MTKPSPKPSPTDVHRMADIADGIEAVLEQHGAKPNDAVVAMASLIGAIAANTAKSRSELDTIVNAVRKVIEHSATTLYHDKAEAIKAKGGTIQ